MQRAARLEKVVHVELLLEVGVDPKVPADGDVDVPGEDGIGNISPGISICPFPVSWGTTKN